MTDKRRMTVDELLGPELTSELGIENPRRVVETTRNDSPNAAEFEAGKTDETPAPTDENPALAVTVEEDLESERESGSESEHESGSESEHESGSGSGSLEYPLSDEQKPSKPARVPLPPSPGQPMSRGRIPSITTKNKTATTAAETEPAAAPLTEDSAEVTAPGGPEPEPPPSDGVKSATESPADEPKSAARFPREEARFLWTAVRQWLRALPAFTRVIVFATPVVLVLAAVVAAVQLSGPSFERAYIVADHTMLAVPTVDETTYGSVGDIERNEEVLVLERQQSFALVRDPVGRVGWVQDSYLSEAMPPVGPDLEFTRCYRRINEETVQPCQDRAAFQSESCMGHCEELANPTPCEVECESHRTRCENNCALTLRELRGAERDDSALDELYEPKPIIEPTAEPELSAGNHLDAEPEATIVETEEPAVKKKMKKKRKKRRKRKKRKR